MMSVSRETWRVHGRHLRSDFAVEEQIKKDAGDEALRRSIGRASSVAQIRERVVGRHRESVVVALRRDVRQCERCLVHEFFVFRMKQS